MSIPIKRVTVTNSETVQAAPVEEKRPPVTSIASIKAKLAQAAPTVEPVAQAETAMMAMSSDEPASHEDVPDTVDPSLYYQVLKLTRQLGESLSQINSISDAVSASSGRLEVLETALSNPDDPNVSVASSIAAIRKDLDDVVNNLKMVTNQVTTNSAPSSYANQVVTYELKQAGSIGLGPTQGMSSADHVFVQTVSKGDASWANFMPYQMATKDGKSSWFRQATADNQWTPWTGSSSGGTIIYSASQPSPAAQQAGDIWISPL